MTNLKTGDEVVSLSGKDAGKKGKILKVLPKKGKVLVSGVNMVKRHVKGEKSPLETEAPLFLAKVQLICPKCGKKTRIGVRKEEGKKVRVCRKCGKEI